MKSKNKRKNGKNGFDKLLKQLLDNKAKTAIAACLLVLMLFMWVKVLAGKGPAHTSASQSEGIESQLKKIKEAKAIEERIKIEYVELPAIEGRHNVLKRDFFSTGPVENKSKVEVVNNNKDKDVSGLNKKLSLEAIEMGTVPQVFINGKLLGIGEILKVADGEQIYEFEIKAISENEVKLKHKDIEFKLSIGEPDDVIE